MQITDVRIFFCKDRKHWRVKFKLDAPVGERISKIEILTICRLSERYRKAVEFCGEKNKQIRKQRWAERKIK